MVTRNLSPTKVEDHYKTIIEDMIEKNNIFGLYSKEGEFLTDHFKKEDKELSFSLTASYYLAMNLNFIESFSNKITARVHDQNGFEPLSSETTFRWLHHMKETETISANSKARGTKVDPKDYDEGIIVLLLKFPKEWRFFKRGQARINLESCLIYNPGEMEKFLLRRNF